jgi:hypothetical protein
VRTSFLTAETTRGVLARGLRARRSELEQAALAQIRAISRGRRDTDLSPSTKSKAAILAAVSYGIEAVGNQELPPVPAILLAEARFAARAGLELKELIRRYLVGYRLVGDFLLQEADRTGLLGTSAFRELFHDQAEAVDRVIATISDEYALVAEGGPRSPTDRRVRLVDRLLAGEPLATSELAYDFDAWHIGLIFPMTGPAEVFDALLAEFPGSLLSISREGHNWAWVASRRRSELNEFADRMASNSPSNAVLALGEPGHHLGGWRVTHRQAQEVLDLIRAKSGAGPMRYAEVAVIASVRQDELLLSSLRDLYLAPLEDVSDGGATFRRTLRAYFKSGRNTASAAAALGVNRNTVASRLRRIETLLARPLDHSGDLELALRLHDQLPGSMQRSLSLR